METAFTEQQLRDPDLARAAGVIRRCVRHGFCPQTCPTYLLTGDENDSPRGRIDLMHAMLASGAAPDRRTVHHLDRCLSCLGCESTCAARLDYRALIDHARVHIERHYRRPWRERLVRRLIASVLPYPRRLRAMLALARPVRGLRHLLPATLRPMLEMIPPAPARVAAPATAATPRPSRGRVVLLAGCVQQVLGERVIAATERLLARHGYAVSVLRSGCCGGLPLHMGRDEQARDLARGLLRACTADAGPDAVDGYVSVTSGCGTTLKALQAHFAHEPEAHAAATAIAGKVRDLSELLGADDLRVAPGMPALPLAYHEACSLRHGQRLGGAMQRLLQRAGFEVLAVPESHLCCGSAGTYNLLQPELAGRLGARKAAAIGSTGAVVAAAGNLGCQLQIGRYLGRPVIHSAELLDWATGGPLPPELADLDLEQWPARTPRADAPAVPDDEAINFWGYEP